MECRLFVGDQCEMICNVVPKGVGVVKGGGDISYERERGARFYVVRLEVVILD